MGRSSWTSRRARGPRLLSPRAAYALWAPSYPAHPHNALMAAEQAAVEALLPPMAGRRALDLGCGTGRYARLLAARGAAPVVGVDASPEMLAAGRGDGLARVHAEITALPLPAARLDVVVSGLALNDVADLAAALRECARVLAPGGVLVYSVVHPRGAALGWTREFDVLGRRHAVDGCWHPRAAHLGACADAGLRVAAVAEPSAPGMPDGGPVALVVRAEQAP